VSAPTFPRTALDPEGKASVHCQNGVHHRCPFPVLCSCPCHNPEEMPSSVLVASGGCREGKHWACHGKTAELCSCECHSGQLDLGLDMRTNIGGKR
jgi:hypothetical protein